MELTHNRVDQNYCPKGWKQHINPFLDYLNLRESKMEIFQIKEKFGGLRLYYSIATPEEDIPVNYEEDILVDYLTYLCRKTCTDCGSTDGVTTENLGTWIYTLCETCNKKKKHEKKIVIETVQERKDIL